MNNPRWRLPRPGREQGVIGIMAGLTLGVGLMFAALAVDTGRLYLVDRKLQSVADLAALAAAREPGCAVGVGDLVQRAQDAAARNGYTGNLQAAPNTVETGSFIKDEGRRRFVADGSGVAVRVTASETVPASLLAGGWFGGRDITRVKRGVARIEQDIASFSAGSFLLGLDSEQSALLDLVLGGILNTSLNLGLVAYEGLAAIQLSLLELVEVSTTLVDPAQLLETNLGLGGIDGLYDLALRAASDKGVLTAEAQSALETLKLAADPAVNLRLAEAIDVAAAHSQAIADAQINLLDLIWTSAMVAQHPHALNLSLPLNIAGLLSVNLVLDLIQPPQLAIGPPGQDSNGNWCTQAITSQLRLQAWVQANVLGLAALDLSLNLEVATAEAHLTALEVAAGRSTVVVGATPSVLSASITNTAGTGPATLRLLLALAGADISLDLDVTDGTSAPIEFEVDTPVDQHLPQNASLSSDLGESLGEALADPDVLDIELTGLLGGGLLGALLGGLLDTVETVIEIVVAPLVAALGVSLIDPLLGLLGISVGGVDIQLIDVRSAPLQLII